MNEKIFLIIWIAISRMLVYGGEPINKFCYTRVSGITQNNSEQTFFIKFTSIPSKSLYMCVEGRGYHITPSSSPSEQLRNHYIFENVDLQAFDPGEMFADEYKQELRRDLKAVMEI